MLRNRWGSRIAYGSVEAEPGHISRLGMRQPVDRRRLAAIPDASTASLEGFIIADTEESLTVFTDGWIGYRGLDIKGYAHDAINLSANSGDASLRLSVIHLVFSTLRDCGEPVPCRDGKRWLIGAHYRAVRAKCLQRYFDFRFNRKKAMDISHGFARLIQHTVDTPPSNHRRIVHGVLASALRRGRSNTGQSLPRRCPQDALGRLLGPCPGTEPLCCKTSPLLRHCTSLR